MADSRQHRGPHPKDRKLFSPDQVPVLQQATGDLSLLLTKGYPENAALKLVGDRFRLTRRQRLAVLRSSHSEEEVNHRLKHRVPPWEIEGREMEIDGFNFLITLESALSGGYLFKGKDGCIKDIAGLHGNYRKVTETMKAIKITGEYLETLSAGHITWYLDRPVSNSGRLRTLIADLAIEKEWPWEVKLVTYTDEVLMNTEDVVVSSDGHILYHCTAWFNLTAELMPQIEHAAVVDLS